jgi:hypothetical protein
MLRDHLDRFLSWLIPPAEQTDSRRIDTEYVASIDYAHIETGEEKSRCNLCGLVIETESFPDLLEHVGSHDDVSPAADINPFESGPPRTEITLELVEEVEEWRQEEIES